MVNNKYYIYKKYQGQEKVLMKTYRNGYMFSNSTDSNIGFSSSDSASNYYNNNYNYFRHLIEEGAEICIKTKGR